MVDKVRDARAGERSRTSWGAGSRQPTARNTPTSGRLVVVSNRLPVRLSRGEEGGWTVRPSSGGLVTALHPVLTRRGGSWAGWPGVSADITDEVLHVVAQAGGAFDLRAVPLTAEERDRYYLGFSNRVLWPLFHGFPSLVELDPRDWETYQQVNGKFADVLAHAGPSDSIWVQDYHLMLLGRALRSRGYRQSMGFFLHIPFPRPKVLRTLPQYREILRGLLSYDFVGFQTGRDHENYLAALEAERMEGRLRRGPRAVLASESWPRPLDPLSLPLPISIDFDEWSSKALETGVTSRVADIRRSLGHAETLILGVDRLDYTKGIPHKLRGLRRALGRFPELRGKVTLIQLVVPSREGIPTYQDQKRRIEELVEEINGEFGRADWQPVRYIYGEWDRDEITAHYRAADVALVTPLRDGMNLVSKEYCASRVREAGALILSRRAGAAGQLQRGAILVDPKDPDEVAQALRRAMSLPFAERRNRMASMRRNVMEEDVHWWADSFVRGLDACRTSRTSPRRWAVGAHAPLSGSEDAPPTVGAPAR